ncbi:MAG TPA: PEP/pyruvate-binding domain-containing protein [Anaeromyxobacteraceae bacterium]|nr:PEP/pyruvate-binding domain-containing protein [Anaeromyxobacteraceae bacterium]
MAWLLKALSQLFRPAPKPGAAELQAAFRSRYRSFRSLITANNAALETMAEMEAALHSGKPFGMAFVRGQCTALGVNVYKMIQGLRELSDGRYRDLPERFGLVTGRIEAILSRQPEAVGSSYVLPLEEIDRRAVDQVGAKLANLGEVRNRLGLRVPEGFAITAAASRHFLESTHLQDEINRRLKTLDLDDLEALFRTSTAIQKLIGSAPLPEDLERAIQDQYRRLAGKAGGAPLLSVRSSALGEDGRQASFAGQYRTRLNVSPELLAHAYRGIVAGKYRSQAIAYRQERGYRHQDVLMCVGCLVMVDAVASGVAFSRPPDQPRSPWILIFAAPGLGTQVVEGRSPSDVFRISRDPPHPIASRQVASAGGDACLPDEQARELAAAAARIEDHFGAPQDIEWALDQAGRIVILQARPIGRAAPQPESAPSPDPDQAEGPPPLLAGGVTASRGAACGPVFTVRSGVDAVHFPRGAVLVVETPYPDWTVLLNRAAAVLSASGQIATHLATVAREFALPAIFDLPGLLEQVTDGQIVTVDATSRRVYPGRVEALLRSPPARPNLMEGSPIHRLLKETLGLVTPLHLTAPGSPFFRASSCRTLHDITRFCHEKAVAEMFDFGRRHGFSDRAAKRLVVAEAPSQWWVIDLDDGFREGLDTSSPFVRVEDVVSAPMRAIWRGMTAVPWHGPPPVSLRGFGAIVVQSTMNPRLDPAVRSSLAGRNYFLVSRSFCNLSVRLGYHFALAEANLSDLLAESYVNFQFKGGAADEPRRLGRVQLLAETLRAMDFRVEMTGDALTARIEKKPVPYLRERLVVLGYLLIHARQIDMVMDDEAFVERYLEKIHADIRMIRERLAEEV